MLKRQDISNISALEPARTYPKTIQGRERMK
jgi:hypothetical protein